jgi:hypothetical protein
MEPKQLTGRRGCLFYGGVVVAVFLILLGLGLVFGIHMAKKVRNQFTDAAAQPLPASTLSPAQYQSVERRVKVFGDALQKGQGPSPLELSEDDINGLINHQEALKGKFHFTLKGNQVRAQVSVPMGEIGLPVFRDRYLNGFADFHVSLSGGSLKVLATNVIVHGKPMPDIYVAQIRKQNLAKAFNEAPDANEVLNRLESVQVTNGRLRILPKQP